MPIAIGSALVLGEMITIPIPFFTGRGMAFVIVSCGRLVVVEEYAVPFHSGLDLLAKSTLSSRRIQMDKDFAVLVQRQVHARVWDAA